MATIRIRRGEPDDFRALQAIHAQPGAIWGTLQVPFASASRWRRMLDEQADDLYLLVANGDDDAVGCLGLHLETRSPRRRHVAILGMAVHDDWQGRGIGKALLTAALDLADHWLNLTRLELTVYTDNVRAIGLYEKRGFAIEGRLRRYAFRAGAFVDAFTMARLR